MWRCIVLGGTLVLGACGSAAPPPATQAPTVRIAFPPDDALTDEPRLLVNGTASGAAAVTIGGVAATSDDGFRTWQAEVDLALGLNTLEAHVAGAPIAAVTVERQTPFFAVPRGIELDAATGTVHVAENRHLYGTIDLATGTRTRHEPHTGFAPVHDISVDPARQLVYISTETGCMRLNLTNGNQGNVQSPAPWTPRGVHWDPTRGRLLVADARERTLYSLPDTGPDVRFTAFDGLVEDAFVLDEAADVVYAMGETIHRLDLETAAVTPISGPGLGSGPAIDPSAVRDLALDPLAGCLYCVTQTDLMVYRIEIATGARSVLAGGGPPLVAPWGIAFDAVAGRLLVSDAALDGLVAIDVLTGERTLIAVPTRGTGPRIRGPEDLAWHTDGRLLLLSTIQGASVLHAVEGNDRCHLLDLPDIASGQGLASLDPGTLVVAGDEVLRTVDLATGDVAILSGAGAGGGDDFDSEPEAVAFAAGKLFVLTVDRPTWRRSSLYRVEPATGFRTRLPFAGHFRAGLGFDPVRGELLVPTYDTVYRVDAASEEIEEIADVGWPGFGVFPDVALDLDGRRACFSGSFHLHRLDLASDRLEIVTHSTATLLPFPSGAVYDPVREVMLVADRRLNALVAVSPDTGEAVIVSR